MMLREDKGGMSPTTAFGSLSLRDSASPTPNDALDDIFGEPAPVATSSQLDDIFGCSPPQDDALISDIGDREGRSEIMQGEPVSSGADVSDIPRLRSTHVTAGYRDGISESKAGHVQQGFDEGFPLGAVLGIKAGWVLGTLEGVAVALRAVALRKGKSDERKEAADAFERARKLLVMARKELDIVSLFGQQYFDDEGIWKYEVNGQEGDITFEQVAAQHPLLSKWLSAVEKLAEDERIDLGILDRRAREDSDEETTTIS
ncbi:Essential protein Yae1 [Macrophomina phaseolina MS6]|uniref:Protein YAE1 n=1 Tax=Macrophomina phaseolina (strain MS6) TaxID=1126212 RepID=K2QNZ1_MACPH|nr:Essential protein Yae1 [Macrophomina phaseolina MS6]